MMDINAVYNDYLTRFNTYLGTIEYPAQPARLYEPIAYTMSLGGKRLRPVLTLMIADMLGAGGAEVLPVALGVEMFHNFTLLHDDVMDRADVRRGKPTVHCKWNDNVAILSGDAMLTMASQFICQAPSRCLSAAMDLFNRTAIEIYEGQQLDMDFETRNDVTVDEYLHMIRLKTSVLIGAACRLGALVSGACDADLDALYDMGLNLGLAFQLKDDLLDVWGDPDKFGKQIGGDIMCDKKTYLLITAMNEAQGVDRETLNRYIGMAEATVSRGEKVSAVTGVYDHLNLRERTLAAINRHSERAIEALRQSTLSADHVATLTALIQMLINREN